MESVVHVIEINILLKFETLEIKDRNFVTQLSNLQWKLRHVCDLNIELGVIGSVYQEVYNVFYITNYYEWAKVFTI